MIDDIEVCSCSPAKALLLSGYFVSAPIRPSFAFDVKMLEFARELYVRSPPNRSAWSSAWEAFLRGRGYKFAGDDIIRRKFMDALRYYCLLQTETGVHVRKCELMLCAIAAANPEESGDAADGDWMDEDILADADYLPTACPLCFGAFAEHDNRAP